jgi:hypothetical protein
MGDLAGCLLSDLGPGHPANPSGRRRGHHVPRLQEVQRGPRGGQGRRRQVPQRLRQMGALLAQGQVQLQVHLQQGPHALAAQHQAAAGGASRPHRRDQGKMRQPENK